MSHSAAVEICIFLLQCTLWIPVVRSSFCGNSTVPYSLEVLPSGTPVLGCARPSCFGWREDGSPVSRSAFFFVADNAPDGFIRRSNRPPNITAESRDFFKPQFARCDRALQRETCADEENLWVGGIAQLQPSTPMVLQCCSYEGLRLSSPIGTAAVHTNQIASGGEVMRGQRQWAFDYIHDIARITLPDGNWHFDVLYRRFPCLPAPTEQLIPVDVGTTADVFKYFGAKEEGAAAFQAPTLLGDSSDSQSRLQTFAGSDSPSRDLPALEEEINSNSVQVSKFPLFNQEQYPQPVRSPNRNAYAEPIYQYTTSCYSCDPRDGYYQYYYYPNQNYGGQYGGAAQGGGAFLCFSADTTVLSRDGRTVRMDELTTEHWVLAIRDKKLTYVNIERWLHRDSQVITDFLRIELDSDTVLKLTPLHFIYKTDCNDTENRIRPEELASKTPVFAREISVGDCLYELRDPNNEYLAKSKVTHITVVSERGIYAPLTSTGDIFVNGVYASCYAVVRLPPLQDSFYQIVDYLRSFIFDDVDTKISQEENGIPFGSELAVGLLHLVLPKGIAEF